MMVLSDCLECQCIVDCADDGMGAITEGWLLCTRWGLNLPAER